MTTSAGRLSSRISQGSPNRSAVSHPAHQVADGGAERHRQREGEGNARQRHAEIEEQRTGTGFLDDRREHDGRQQAALLAGKQRSDPPGGKKHGE